MSVTQTSSEFADGFYNELVERHKNPEKYRGFRTGIPDLDKAIGGLKLGWFVIVGGQQKVGKTALVHSWVLTFGADGRKFLTNGLEMNNFQTATRVFANRSGIPIDKIENLQLTDADFRSLDNERKHIGAFNGLWTYGAYSIDDVVELVHEHDPDILVVDYFQLMEGSKKRYRSRTEEMAEISRTLKKISNGDPNRLRLVIVPTQITREAQKAEDWTSNNIFSETSALEKDCDLAIVIHEDKDPTGQPSKETLMMRIVASRWTKKAAFRVRFLGERALIGGAISEPVVDINELSKQRLNKKANGGNNNKDPW